MEAVESAIFQEVAWQGPLKFEDLMNRLPATTGTRSLPQWTA